MFLASLLVLSASCARTGSSPADAPKGAKPAGSAENTDDFLAGFEDEYADAPTVSDPLRPWNVFWFRVNDKLFFWVIKPVSQGWAFIAPRPARTGVKNFFRNLGFPGRFINTAFQGKFKSTGTELARFGVNSTVGVLGVWDAADHFWGLKEKREDFDQTFAVWGLPSGAFITWPLFGPSTVRGSFGMLFDRAVDPLFWAGQYHWAFQFSSPVKIINDSSLEKSPYETIKEMSVDPYAGLRDAYLQNRQKAIAE
jgi:phospholipid-binding lipoprotein MlaA